MTAIDKTNKLERKDLPVGALVPNDDNPNKMSAREFDLLVDNIERTGLTDPILVRPLGDDKYRIVGGHHRYDAAVYLGFETVPVTINADPDFDDEAEQFQLIRMNVIRGKLDPQAFFDLYSKMSDKYSDEVLQDSFGFAEEVEFQRLIAQAAKTLPDKHLQEKFKEAAAEIKTIDGLSKLLNEMFTKYGDTMPYGYMIVDHGGQKSVWLRINAKTMKAMSVVGDMCIDNSCTVDDLIGGVVQAIARGEMLETTTKLMAEAPKVTLPADLQVAPTYDNIAKVGSL